MYEIPYESITLKLKGRKILHVSAWAKTFTQFRMPLLRGLREAGAEQLIYCPDDVEHARRLKDVEDFPVRRGRVSKTFGTSVVADIIELQAFLRMERFDVVMAHQPLGALVGITAAYMRGVPVKIYSTGGLKYSPDLGGIANSIIKYGELAIIRMADAVLLVNMEDKKALTENPRVNRKAYYVGPSGGSGIDTWKYNPSVRRENRDNARKALGIDDGTFVIGYVGRCVWEKGFRELIEAAYILVGNGGKEAEWRFVVIGEGQHLEEIKWYVDDAGVTQYFVFTGYKFNVEYYMSAFDVFVLPSYREGLPISLLEAMAMGLPTIATDIRGSRELIRQWQTGVLIRPRDAENFAKAIFKLRNSRDQMFQIGKNATEHVPANYSEEALLPRTINIISNIVSERCGHAG